MLNRKKEIDDFFNELQMFGIKLGLEQTIDLFKRLGNQKRAIKTEMETLKCHSNPLQGFQDNFKNLKFIHIAGTNGKGSVATMLLGALNGMGFKVGFYSSPHLISIRERFRINGEAISEATLHKIILHLKPIIDNMKIEGITPTYFEITTAIAAIYFAKEKVDFVLWESGLGGRFDATNIITPELSVITTIGLDHTAYLGDTIAKIAFEKGGIIKKNIPIFSGEIPKEAKTVIESIAKELNSQYFPIKECDKKELLKIENEPLFQNKNRLLAINIIKYLSIKYNFNKEIAINSISTFKWPGRFQIINNDIIIDGAHNPQAMELLVKSLKKQFPNEQFTILFAAFADKDCDKSLKLLATIADEFLLTQVDTGRKTSSFSTLEQIVKKYTTSPIKKVDLPNMGLKVPRNSKLLVTGSLYLVGEILKELIPKSNILNLYNAVK